MNTLAQQVEKYTTYLEQKQTLQTAQQAYNILANEVNQQGSLQKAGEKSRAFWHSVFEFFWKKKIGTGNTTKQKIEQQEIIEDIEKELRSLRSQLPMTISTKEEDIDTLSSAYTQIHTHIQTMMQTLDLHISAQTNAKDKLNTGKITEILETTKRALKSQANQYNIGSLLSPLIDIGSTLASRRGLDASDNADIYIETFNTQVTILNTYLSQLYALCYNSSMENPMSVIIDTTKTGSTRALERIDLFNGLIGGKESGSTPLTSVLSFLGQNNLSKKSSQLAQDSREKKAALTAFASKFTETSLALDLRTSTQIKNEYRRSNIRNLLNTDTDDE